MKHLWKKLESHFKSLDHNQFLKDWECIEKRSGTEGVSVGEFLEYHDSFKYNDRSSPTESQNINFNNLLENPSFTSDFLFSQNG